VTAVKPDSASAGGRYANRLLKFSTTNTASKEVTREFRHCYLQLSWSQTFRGAYNAKSDLLEFDERL